MDLEKYERNQVNVVFQEFHHPVYRQLFGDFNALHVGHRFDI